MDRTAVAPVVGGLAGIGGIIALGLPAIDVLAPGVTGLDTYYGAGVVGGVFPAVLAGLLLVVVVALIGVTRGQSDPALASGVGVGLGAVAALLTAQWALSVDPALVASLGRATWLAWHRWILLALVVLVPIATVAQRPDRRG